MEEKNLEAISSSNLLLILLKVIFPSRKEWPQKLFYVLSKHLRENKIKSKHKKKMKNNLNKGHFSPRVGIPPDIAEYACSIISGIQLLKGAAMQIM